ncbi:MAG: glycosyl hydrolase family 28-related protein, partial [Candidatus Omnitrophota bacterium]|nr:glycosyl hydrolase family 28-related protein [Candidatus Omnitrophota bacterium]
GYNIYLGLSFQQQASTFGWRPAQGEIVETDLSKIFTARDQGNYHPPATSPGIDVGIDLSALGFDRDVEGTLRPQGAGWDIGAYEYMPPIIPEYRRIDWQAGIPGGIPNYPAGTNVKDYGAVGDGVIDDYAAVAEAIAGCPNGRAVYFPAGIYKLSQTIVIKKPQSIVLRGAGPDKTKLIGYSMTGAIIRISYDYAGGVTHNVTGGMSKGSNNLTLDSVSNLNIGDYLRIQQTNDPSVILGNIHLDQPWQGQFLRITGINGNVVTTDRPLYYTYNSAFSPQIKQIANMTTGCGVEDLYVEMQGTGLHNIYMYYAARSWVKNVKSYRSNTSNICLFDSYQIEVRDNFVLEHLNYPQASNYGIQLAIFTTDSLIENNNIQGNGTAVMAQGGAAGNIISYNYSLYGFGTGYPDSLNLTAGIDFHGDNPNMNLVEGNIVMQIGADDTWGSGRANTFFRNWGTRLAFMNYDNVPARWGLVAARADALNYYYNFVGNVLTRPSDAGDNITDHAVFVIGRSNAANQENPSDPVADPRVEATLIKHGNFDYVSGTTQWDPTITDHNLSNSLYLKEKPAFFGNIPWPPIGPDVIGLTNDIPAKYCYERGLMPNCLEDAGKVYGDVSGDGQVSAYDAALALQLGKSALEAGQIAQKAAGLI